MKRQVIVLEFQGASAKSLEPDLPQKPEIGAGTAYHLTCLPTKQACSDFSDTKQVYSSSFFSQVSKYSLFVGPRSEAQQERLKSPDLVLGQNYEQNVGLGLPIQRDEGQINLNEQRKKRIVKKTNKCNYQIKNVLQQICSSIQNCIKDGFIPRIPPTLQEARKRLEAEKQAQVQKQYEQYQKMLAYLENPSQHNIACLLKMGGVVQKGLYEIFKSRILKKYIQCSKIRTLQQKAICLEAVDYLFRCLKHKELCSLHTWCHRRREKINQRNNQYKQLFK